MWTAMDEDETKESKPKHVITSPIPPAIYRWKRHTTLPEGAVLMNPDQVRQVLKSKLEKHPTYLDTFLLRREPGVAATVSSLTASSLAVAMGRVFNTTKSVSVGLGVVATSTFLSVLPTYTAQSAFIQEPILSGLNMSLPKVTAISLASQTFFGILLPCGTTGYKVFTTQINPNLQKGNFGWFCKTILTDKTFIKILYRCLAVQIFFGGVLPFLTLDQFEEFTYNALSSSSRKNNSLF